MRHRCRMACVVVPGVRRLARFPVTAAAANRAALTACVGWSGESPTRHATERAAARPLRGPATA